ncbi:hypothetical protein GOODEAATRI_021541 [Goodea atripinnis]|uniref:Uncharacterized protein n=1 Tax=Goodea atripinnis TaxID=208336 RepID=A0ABV0PFW2_9TELE
MDKAKSLVDNKGASGPLHVNNVQSPRGLNGLVVVAANGSCSGSNAFGLSTGPSSSTPEMHHLQRGEEECNGSPAKRCRLRRRTESVKRNRPPRRRQGDVPLCLSTLRLHLEHCDWSVSGGEKAPDKWAWLVLTNQRSNLLEEG